MVAAGLGAAFVRTYAWTIPTLSLGYFQNLAQVHADPRFQSVPLVRRVDRRRRDLASPRDNLRAGRAGRSSSGSTQHRIVQHSARRHRGGLYWSWEFPLPGAANSAKWSLATEYDHFYALLTPIRKIS